ncbi:MAG TPA: alpha/beta fold hydrolase [Candidatus Thermoplasmatota archaeon]|nr:alpha/beta fold hydrolase [Candidatus Thermoplasmatota archaeon]
MSTRPESRSIPGPVGRLDSRWHGPAEGRPVVLLHPHPLLGGTMGSRLVYDLAVGLAEDGWRSVRFDFRGAGRSEGDYGEGLGETEDALAVLAAVEAQAGRTPALIGYSFGGAVACRAAAARRVDRLVTVAAPAQVLGTRLDALADAPRVTAPAHVIVGDRDPYVSVDLARTMAAAFRPPAGLTVLAAASHFLEPGDNPRVLAAVRAALAD